MRRTFANVLLSLVSCQLAWASAGTNYLNYGVVTVAPVVDATSFYNAGQFAIDNEFNVAATNLTDLTGLVNLAYGQGTLTVIPFRTKDTLYYTNALSGTMSGLPGFEFDTTTSTKVQSASLVLNQGALQGMDGAAALYLWTPPNTTFTTFVPVPADNQPTPSEVLIQATNIINSGTISVGSCGVLRLTGHNVTNSDAILTAGEVATVTTNGTAVGELGSGLLTQELGFDETDTGLQGQYDWSTADGKYYYDNSPFVYDIFWGATNVDTLGLATTFDPPNTRPMAVNLREFGNGTGVGNGNYGFITELPFNLAPEWGNTTIAYTENGTNIYYNIVFVNTNFADTNLSAAVGFTAPYDPQGSLTATTDDGNALEAIVQFSEQVTDVITGDTVTNGVYLLDDGAILPAVVNGINAGTPNNYDRPNCFEVTTETPVNWIDAALIAQDFAFPYNYDLIYTPEQFANKTVTYTGGFYGVQIGRNPGELSGTFSTMPGTDAGGATEMADFFSVLLPDPTNEAGRIEINAQNLDLTQARMRAEGMVLLNATNLVGGGTAAVDWGQFSGNVGSTNGALIVSNVFPTTFQRVRGDIYAWSATWVNTQTNNGPGTTSPVTNAVHYHMLVVDQNLYGSFQSTARNLTLTGKQSIVLQDSLNVIGHEVFNTTNLVISNSLAFSEDANDFTSANAPYLQNLFVGNNGSLDAADILDVGFNQSQGQTGPTGRSYIVNSITNEGLIASTSPLLQARYFDNDGTITSTNNGSILIQASTLGLGLAGNPNPNYLIADGSVYLSGHAILASNSIIEAGLTQPGPLTLDLDASGQLTDFVPGTPTTNTNVTVNTWNVTDGFVMPVKPVIGDLFGTEIHSIATGLQQVQHIWAATDKGPDPAGFVNNAVIGHLVLDRQSSNSVFRFSGAGSGNAMYVDYLELTNYAYTNYRSGIEIDPNFTVYFAYCNVEPEKLTSVHGGLVWVTNFVGPNSTQVVPYTNSAAVCLMNKGVANSTEIAFWDGIPNFTLLQNSPYLLNMPLNLTPPYIYSSSPYSSPDLYKDCTAVGGDYFCTNCIDGTNVDESLATNTPSGSSWNFLTVAYNGQGSITPALTQSGLVLGSTYTLTATPAKGWVFDSWVLAGLGGNSTTTTNVITFAFVTNTIVTANFIPSPFPALKGKYNGLFYQTNAIVNPASSGAFSLTMSTSGTFSGQLLMGPVTYSFSSFFAGDGAATFVATPVQKSSRAPDLTVNLQLDITNLSGQIMGDVTNSVDNWDAALLANLAPSYTTTIPSPAAGNYTFVFPWETGVTNQQGGGDSYGTATVSKAGALTVVGKLADGTTFSESSSVGTNGLSPFYVYAAAGLDEVLGWVTVTNGSVTNGIYSTNIGWSKGATGKAIYGSGFVNAFQMWGSAWNTPSKASPPLSIFNPVLLLNDGDLATPLSLSVTQANYLSFTGPNASLSITPSTGAFSGWFEVPGSKVKRTISGVVLTNTGTARGFFLGTDQSGSVLLQGQ